MRDSELNRAELFISNVLRHGVLLCAFFLAMGLGLAFAKGVVIDFSPRPVMTVPSEIFSGLAVFNPEAWIATGLFLLVALPIVRVALTVGLFWIERDKVYLAITLLVLAVLLTSLFFGKAL